MTAQMPLSITGHAVPVLALGTSQKISVASSSGQSAALGSSTEVVALCATTDCFIASGASPTATADGTSMYLPAGVVRDIRVDPGSKIAAIRSTADGTLYITELK